MQIPVLTEHLSEGQFRAYTGPPWDLTADGATASAPPKT